MNDIENSSETRLPEAELRHYLRAYLLSSEQSQLAVVVEQIIKAYRFKLPLEILAQQSRLTDRVVAVLNVLEIRYLVDDSPKNNAQEIIIWLQRTPPRTVRIWLPDAKSRFRDFQDFEVLVPFAVEKAVHELRRYEPKITTPQIDSLYLIFLKTVATSPIRPQDLEDQVFRDVVDLEKLGVLSSRYALAANHELVKATYGCLMEMSPIALLYIGCDPGGSICKDVPYCSDLQNHPLNRHGASVRATHVAACYSGIGSTRHSGGTVDFPRYPRVIKQMQWSVPQIATIARNLPFLEQTKHELSSPIKDRGLPPKSFIDTYKSIFKCLRLRLEGKSETKIAKELGYSSRHEYEAWLCDHHIDIKARKQRSPYEEHLEARKVLGLETLEAEDLCARTALQQQPSATSKSEADVSGAEEQETSVKDTRADVATGEQQSQLPVVEVHASTEEVWIDGQQVSVRGKKLDRLNALIFWILQQQKTGKPVESFRILKAAKVEKQSIRVDHLYRGTPFQPLISHPRHGHSWLNIDLAKSKVS